MKTMIIETRYDDNNNDFRERMAGRGEMFQEVEEKRRVEGFFPKIHKSVCENMGDANIEKLVKYLVITLSLSLSLSLYSLISYSPFFLVIYDYVYFFFSPSISPAQFSKFL